MHLMGEGEREAYWSGGDCFETATLAFWATFRRGSSIPNAFAGMSSCLLSSMWVA